MAHFSGQPGDGWGLPGLGALAGRIEQIAPSGPPAILLDFDGTLAEIVSDPAAARVDPAARMALGRLAGRLPLAIVSGRALDDVRSLIGLEHLTYFGSHGRQVSFADGTGSKIRGGNQSAIDSIADQLGELAQKYSGARLEQKPLAVVLHYRNLADPESGFELAGEIEALAREHDGLRMLAGRKIFEFVPADGGGKGAAVDQYRRYLAERSIAIHLPIYLGDDVTDEDAFARVEGNGIGVLVAGRARPTGASHRVPGVGAVAALLTLIARRFGGSESME